jgi:hypothetical protein
MITDFCHGLTIAKLVNITPITMAEDT